MESGTLRDGTRPKEHKSRPQIPTSVSSRLGSRLTWPEYVCFAAQSILNGALAQKAREVSFPDICTAARIASAILLDYLVGAKQRVWGCLQVDLGACLTGRPLILDPSTPAPSVPAGPPGRAVAFKSATCKVWEPGEGYSFPHCRGNIARLRLQDPISGHRSKSWRTF